MTPGKKEAPAQRRVQIRGNANANANANATSKNVTSKSLIAHLTGMTHDSVRVHLSRGMKHLREILHRRGLP